MPHQHFMSQLYVGLLQRAPDAAGLDYWVSNLENGDWTRSQIENNWIQEQAEFHGLYAPSENPSLFVSRLYLNILGREPDPEGAAYWTEQLINGLQTPQTLPLTILNTVRQQQNTADALLLQQRTEIGLLYAEAGLNDLPLAHAVTQATFADHPSFAIASSLIAFVREQPELAREAQEILMAVRPLALNDDAASLSKIAANVEAIAQTAALLDGPTLLKVLPAETAPQPPAPPAPLPIPQPLPNPGTEPGGDSGNDSDDGAGSGSDDTSPEPLDQALPWRLLMGGVDHEGAHRVFVSDGTLAGTGFVPDSHFYFPNASQILTNEQQTTAVIANVGRYSGGQYGTTLSDITLYVSDGTLPGTTLLAGGITTTDTVDHLTPFRFDMGWAFLGADWGQEVAAAGIITDGTLSGTFPASVDVPVIEVLAIDSQRGVLWHLGETWPGGRELYRIARDGDSWQQQQVKDIAPGTEDGLAHWSNWYSLADASVLLDDGQLAFLATPHADYYKVPYLSDGTTGGTRPLLELPADVGSLYVDQPIFAYQGRAAFLGLVQRTQEQGYRESNELIISDGTPAGTQYLSLPEQNYYEAKILGVSSDRLYIQARHWDEDADREEIVILISSGSSPTLFATGPADLGHLELLGFSDSTIFFKGRDVDHGDELWTLDQASGELSLTSDIFPGSNAALAGDQVFFIHNDQAILTAYTSHTKIGVVVSDGTAEGTQLVGSGKPLTQLLVDDSLAYTTTQGVFVVDLTESAPTAARLGDALEDYWSYQQLQADSDQLYFTTPDGELKSHSLYSGTTVTLIEGDVVNFRVVGENGIFAIVEDHERPALWFSDGTADGSTFVVDLTDYGSDYNTYSWQQGIQYAAGLYNLF